ncbi:hypothetical protein N658DRAFT_419500 [Parathielavia hyrcaniae]|uniref:Uncharacterized protein n=1 Tax=Parathielavia hyrcaniae TaxID=113614 RepID=A0AAN6Q7K0_9PEZI|nr:hypothetical protein N658DRAFT_419500 [Parathielavia hyrcaniae]
MATSPQAFYCLWQNEAIRERLFEHLPKEDICSLRLANSACCNLVTKRLFLRTHLTFTANSLTKASRIEALSRIGHHIEHLTFYFPHSHATFLPPLIHPQSGEEICFLYNPHTSTESTRPQYGNSELGEILTQQYPPLFHSATNVASFIKAMKHLTSMRHLTIKTPGQDPRERYRRDVVDYALMSLRISLERAPLTKLSKLTLSAVHPSAFTYLRHAPGFGALPSAAVRWRQIRKLYISVESWDFYGPSPGLDHLKIMDDYIQGFAPQLDKLSFTWLGRRGPCPIALSGDPLFAPPRNSKKLFNEVTSPMSPLPPRPFRRPLVMPRLRSMAVRNATMNVDQLRGLVASHKRTVREFDFENVALMRGGSWDEALAPLTEGEQSDAWSRRSVGATSDCRPPPGTSRSHSFDSAVASSVEDEQLPASSAAAEAASRELFEVDLEGVVFGGPNDVDVDTLEAGVEEWARGVTAASAQEPPRPVSAGGQPQNSRPNSAAGGRTADDGGLASDIEAARQASQGFTTKLKKRRVRRRSSKKHDESEPHQEDVRKPKHDERRSERHSDKQHRQHSRSHHKHSRSDDTSSDRHSSSRDSPRRHRHHHHHQRHRSEEAAVPELTFMPEVVGTDDEDESYQPSTPRPKLEISVPILNADALPAMLLPTVYDPSAARGPLMRSPDSYCSSTNKTADDDDGLSPTQRSIEADLLAEAQEAAARSSALRRAKQAVMTKLSREFSKRSRDGSAGERSRNNNSNNNKGESAAVVAAAAWSSALNLSMNLQAAQQQQHCGGGGGGLSCASSSNVGHRLREGFFGKSMAHLAMPVAPDHRSVGSQTALVPLIFSRS